MTEQYFLWLAASGLGSRDELEHSCEFDLGSSNFLTVHVILAAVLGISAGSSDELHSGALLTAQRGIVDL